MGRRPCCSKVGLNRGAWSPREDRILANYISIHGEGKWRDLPKKAGLQRCGKSCRLRWLNYLRPDIKRGNISPDEEDLIIRLHKLLGNRWSIIAGRLPGRTDNEIKNYWNTNLRKRVKTQSTKTTTHKSPNRSEEKQKKTQPTKTWTEAGPLACNPLHQAIRTKAVRCTKAVLLPRDQDCGIKKNVQRTCDESSPMMSLDDDGSLDFLVDFDIGELPFFDGPDSNTSQVSAAADDEIDRNCEGIGLDYGAHDLSSCYDDFFLLDSAIVEDWRGSDCLLGDAALDLEFG